MQHGQLSVVMHVSTFSQNFSCIFAANVDWNYPIVYTNLIDVTHDIMNAVNIPVTIAMFWPFIAGFYAAGTDYTWPATVPLFHSCSFTLQQRRENRQEFSDWTQRGL